MAATFPSHNFDFYQQPQWPVNAKQPFKEDDDLSVLDEKILDATTPGDQSAASDIRKSAFEYAAHSIPIRENMWRDVPPVMSAQHTRAHSYIQMPQTENHHPFMRIDPTYAAAYAQPPPFAMAADSGTSTPTPLHEQMSPDFQFGAPVHYPATPFTFNHPSQPHEPSSAIPMSPQSSQGGWMSATSSDTTETRSKQLRNPTYAAASPSPHIRQDGIRKKNARFDIPAERNLHNIDTLIMQTSDETEKKELKQQKRLLRNRQAALDSRQRKKQHTEKLEQEKKDFNNTMSLLEEQREQLQEVLQRERDIWMGQRQSFEHYIRRLEVERDEAIRSKTLETADLRKMNGILKRHLQDFERQGLAAMHQQASEFNDISSFDNLGIDDGTWEDDFALISSQDLQMDSSEQQVAPHPPRAASVSRPVDPAKTDMPFSWNAFYMCLLFGAFIASTSNSSTTSSSIQAAIPPLSDEYRVESANVLKAVLASGPDQSHTLIPGSQPRFPAAHQATTISAADVGRMTPHPQPSHHLSSLDRLHSSLTSPSRHQQESAAFSLSAATYSHLTNPDTFYHDAGGDMDDDDDEDYTQAKPTRLETAYADMQESRQRDGLDRAFGAELQGRSLLWERVPEKVLRDFRDMVERAQQQQQQQQQPAQQQQQQQHPEELIQG